MLFFLFFKDDRKSAAIKSLQPNRKIPWPFLLITSFVNMRDAKLGTPPIGGAFDFVMRYATLYNNVRVMRSDHLPAFIFGEKTVNIFKNPSQVRQEKGNSILTSGLRLVFCDNAQHLLKYYFKNFHFDGVEKPWMAFTNFWPPEIIADHFGIKADYISDDYSFVVLSIARYHDSRNLTGFSGNLEFDKTAVSAANEVIVGNDDSLNKFSRKFGTHYINSFVTGDLIYQVRKTSKLFENNIFVFYCDHQCCFSTSYN